MLPYRRVEDVIDAWRRAFGARVDPPALLVAGTSDQREYSRVLRNHAEGITYIRFLGDVAADEMPALYRGAAVVVMSTEVEACPNVASGRPLVCADIPALRSIVGDAALYYPPRDVEILAKTLIEIVECGRSRDKLVAASLDRARLFDWDETARRTFETLTGGLEPAAPATH
jgi:glycosyltransferase involved in cell wall biosynthesis